jgi:hypothetical protein
LHLTYESEISLKRQYRTCGPTWALSKVPTPKRMDRPKRGRRRANLAGREFPASHRQAAKAIAAASERPASGNQCERTCKLISRWHRDELGARAQGSATEMLESVSTDSRDYPQEGGGRFTGMPCMTLRLRIRYRVWCFACCAGSCGGCARAIRRGVAPDLERARSGAAPRQEAASPAGRGDSPAIASYRFRALKVPPGRHGMSLA